MKDGAVRDRLYYACTGWIGRNVFSRWKTGHTASEFAQRDQQLSAGAKALCRYTKDRRFLRLPEIQSAAESWLPDMIRQYQKQETHPFLRAQFSMIEGEEEFIPYSPQKKARQMER